MNEENVGIVPRAVKQLFNGITKRQEEARESGLPPPEFKGWWKIVHPLKKVMLRLFFSLWYMNMINIVHHKGRHRFKRIIIR